MIWTKIFIKLKPTLTYWSFRFKKENMDVNTKQRRDITISLLIPPNLNFHILFTNDHLSKFANNIYILLTKREGRTGRILARGLDSTDLATLGPCKKDRGPIFSQYGPEQAWSIRDLLHD